MCGIAGFILARGQRPEPELLDRMAERLAHRGPDDRGRYCAGPVGLVQTRLSIIGLESGHQPLLSADGRLALVANGEIYNYIELNAELRALGRAPRTGSDSETILNVYAADGLKALARLRGMFAFALHDAREGSLILGRDRLGIKPLFYVRLPDRIAFASEIKALLAVLPQSPRISSSALRQFLQNQFAGGEETLIEGIRRVPPGTAFLIDADLNIRTHRYWSALEVEPRRIGLEEACAELDALLDAVMREHRRSDVPFGLFLSGGLDSAVLAAKLAEQGAGRLKSYSVGYRGTTLAHELDEAARVAAHFGFEHHPLELDLAKVFGRLPHTVWCVDELMRDYACLPTSILAETAGAELKVVFSGEGGDEAFAGYGRYRPPLVERLLKSILHPGSGGFRTRGQWAGRWTRHLMGPALRAVAAADRAPVLNAWRATPRHWSDLQRRQYTDLVTALPDNLLVKTDRLLMGFGVEGRVPFLDHRIVEFGLALPDALKVQDHQGKWLVRRWAEPRLPPGHLERPKRGFHVPVGDWLRGDMAAEVGRRLAINPGVRDWFEVGAIPKLVAARQAGRGGGRELFGLMQFAIWYRLFIEQPGLRPAPDEDPLDWI
ncbi:asparagine synthase (glutamine-hydrolyzing) [Thermochromatium tepidum]|uniref:asparagine synthase (glutamine-hydrolyzing) n=1 Tax=Thermochromatium tepidum ATCC 43061 TaxID=316276 RepID=A0A6I6EHR3_THETI|nr:asparagine synthase (glutamine-hydrolyzing) [Thermochromatium tepidum]QGU33800.1 asparagine synthase (glutamine-hydrolyzing) [Thermochromatium tepidum ATCC 43061]